MVGTKQEELFPAAWRPSPAERRPPALVVEHLDASAPASSTSASRPGRARSSASPASPARASSCCSASCSASAARPAATVRYPDGGPLPAARRQRRGAGEPRAGRSPPPGPDARTQHRRATSSQVSAGALRSTQPVAHAARRRRRGATPDRPARHQDRRPLGRRVGAVGRQPAEGRPRQVAGGLAHRGPARRPDPRRRRRRQARDLRPRARSSPTPGASSCSARRSCRSSSVSPTASSSSTVVAWRGVSRATSTPAAAARRTCVSCRADQHRRSLLDASRATPATSGSAAARSN